MQISNLSKFITIADTGSISKAADILYVSQPALSQLISAMEKELGFDLIEHSRRSALKLTPAGEHFYAYAKNLLEGYDRCLLECRNLADNKKKTLYVYMEQKDALILGADTIYRYISSHPDVGLNVLYESRFRLPVLLVTDKADLAFGPKQTRLPSGFEYEHVAYDKPAITMMRENPLSSKEELTVEDLKGQTVCFPEGDPSIDFLEFKNRLDAMGDVKTIHTKNIIYPSVNRESTVYITNWSYKVTFHTMKILPLNDGWKVSMGFVHKKDADQEVLDFVAENIRYAKEHGQY